MILGFAEMFYLAKRAKRERERLKTFCYCLLSDLRSLPLPVFAIQCFVLNFSGVCCVVVVERSFLLGPTNRRFNFWSDYRRHDSRKKGKMVKNYTAAAKPENSELRILLNNHKTNCFVSSIGSRRFNSLPTLYISTYLVVCVSCFDDFSRKLSKRSTRFTFLKEFISSPCYSMRLMRSFFHINTICKYFLFSSIVDRRLYIYIYVIISLVS